MAWAKTGIVVTQVLFACVLLVTAWWAIRRRARRVGGVKNAPTGTRFYEIGICSTKEFVRHMLGQSLDGLLSDSGLPVRTSSYEPAGKYDAVLIDLDAPCSEPPRATHAIGVYGGMRMPTNTYDVVRDAASLREANSKLMALLNVREPKDLATRLGGPPVIVLFIVGVALALIATLVAVFIAGGGIL